MVLRAFQLDLFEDVFFDVSIDLDIFLDMLVDAFKVQYAEVLNEAL